MRKRVGSARRQIRSAAGYTFSQLTQKIMPEAVTGFYAFSGGVAGVSSIATVLGHFLKFFAMTSSITVTGPFAAFVGLSLAYYNHQSNQRKMLALQESLSDIHDLARQNQEYEQRFCAYFSNQEYHPLCRLMSHEAGGLVLQKPYFRDKRALGVWAFETTRFFIKDATLTFGGIAFVFMMFTAIELTGTFLAVALVGCIVLAGLTSYFIHRKDYYYKSR